MEVPQPGYPVSYRMFTDALNASAPKFASGSWTGPGCVCTTQLAMVIIGIYHPAVRCGSLCDLVSIADCGMPVTMPAGPTR
jgi:hypothetical protein